METQSTPDKILYAKGEDLEDFERDMAETSSLLPNRLNADPEDPEKGLAKLVLTVIELIRKLVEKQAVRRVEGGNLSEQEIERLGLALMRLEGKMAELKNQFGLEDDDLMIDLGPLGELGI